MALLAQKRKTDFVITSWYPMKTDKIFQKILLFVFCCTYSIDQFFMTGVSSYTPSLQNSQLKFKHFLKKHFHHV